MTVSDRMAMELLRLFGNEPPREPVPPVPSPGRRWRLLAPLRRAMRRADARPGLPLPVGFAGVGLALLLLAGGAPPGRGLFWLLGSLLLVLLVFGALAVYVRHQQPKEASRPSSQALLLAVILVVLATVWVGEVLASSVSLAFPHLPSRSLLYAAPGALAGVLLAVLFDARLTFAGSLAFSILATVMVSVAPRFEFFFFTFMGCMVGAFGIAGQQVRTGFFKAGALVAVSNALALLGFRLLYGFEPDWPFDLAAGLANGAAVGVLATGLLPLLEYLFDAATEFTLLELGNLNQPLLKYLILTAPGTYHHSVVVGTLAGAAAEAIGANSLLCRVGAHYHDIGKVKKPGYFTENHPEAPDRHARLAPHLSSLVVASHVRDGVELGEAHGLPRAILDLIPQHHGTRLVSFCYERAREATDPSLEAVAEEAYRYPGPKPQTREAAILMLADTVEAASRTLEEPTPARLQGLVQTLANEIFVDGQLEECDLTLRDLQRIAKSFVRVLTAMFHARVEYPGVAPEAARRRDENVHVGARPAGREATDPDQQPVPAKGRRGDPRRGGTEGGRLHPDPGQRFADGSSE